MSDPHKLIIIGSGPAGLTAALYAARGNLSPIVFLGSEPGGQLMTTTDVENYPGFPEGIQGPELIQKMMDQAKRFGAELRSETVTKVDFSGPPHHVFVGETEYSAHAVIIATGASALWLGMPSETRLRGRGVSSCATCDGAFFRNKDVVVIGGGDSALEDSLFLTKFASSVTIVHRKNTLRASKIMQDRASKNPKIRFIWNSILSEIQGEMRVEAAIIENLITKEKTTLPVQGVFIAIGHRPNTKIFEGHLPLDVKGYLVREDLTRSNIDGVFIAGDVSDIRYRQAITAAASGCQAAMDVERFLDEKFSA